MKTITKSILEAFHGALLEKADNELLRVLANIADINTSATKKRKITIELEFVPANDRKRVRVLASAKSKIEPTAPIETTLFTVSEVDQETGVVKTQLHEVMDVPPGQINLDGVIAEQEIILIGISDLQVKKESNAQA